MAGKKNIMTAIKRVVSPKSQRATTTTGGQGTLPIVSKTPLTDFICSRLEGENLKLFGLMFAEAIKNDRHAETIWFEDVFKFLGYTRYDSAVKQLIRNFSGKQTVSAVDDNLRFKAEVTPGPSKDRYLISVKQFEKLLVEAKTSEGALARDMMLEVKDAVQDYIKWEMEAASRAAMEREKLAQQQLEEQTSRLALKDQRLRELDDVLQTERSQKERMTAQREADDEPRQTLYLYRSRQFIKIGETETDAKKRGKALQTGNPEDLELVLEAKCIDSKRIEASLHHIFRWHRRRGEWFDVPAETATYFARLVISILDGARQIDFQEVSADEACRELLKDLRLTPNCAINDTAHRNHETSKAQSEKPDLRDPYTRYIDEGLDITLASNDRLLTTDRTHCKTAIHRRKVPY